MGEEMAQGMSAHALVFSYSTGYVDSMVLKCAIQLKIADTIHAHAQHSEGGAGITLSELAKSLPLDSPNEENLHRLMRYLVHMRLFDKSTNDQGTETFTPNLASELIRTDGEKSIQPLILPMLEEPVISAWNCLRVALDADYKGTPFEAKHGCKFWEALAHNPGLNKKFNDAMAVDTGVVMPAVSMMCKDVFQRIGSLVDVGGGTGTVAAYLATVFPHIEYSVLDLPHVITAAIECPNVELIAGDMFSSIPHADAVLLKRVLHDWGDDECVKILKRCKEAIPKDGGVVMVVEVVMDEEVTGADTFLKAKLASDVGMMTCTGGRERSLKDWKLLLNNAGFEACKITPVSLTHSVIEARPLLLP